MTPNEIDRIIHEARGLCWHEWEYIDTDYSYGSWDSIHKCTKCGVLEWSDRGDEKPAYPSYTTSWEAWGEALEWAQGRDWYDQFIVGIKSGFEHHSNPLTHFMFWSKTILSPLRGSTAFAEFIRANPQLFRKGE